MKLSKYSWSDSEVNNGHFCSEIKFLQVSKWKHLSHPSQFKYTQVQLSDS